MKIGVIGAGRIGGNCAAQAVKGGHEVMLSFARDPSKLQAGADQLGAGASVGSPRDAVQFGDVVGNFEGAGHEGERFLFAILAFAEPPDGVRVTRIAGEMISADAFDRDQFAAAQPRGDLR